MANTKSHIRCAKCQTPGATAECISDFTSGKSTFCYFTVMCGCSIPAPICWNCRQHRLVSVAKFKCTWCNKITMDGPFRITRMDHIPEFMGVVLVLDRHVLVPEMHRSKLFKCFGASMTGLSEDWRCVTRFFNQLEDGFIPDIFFASMKMNMRKLGLGISRRISPYIFRNHTKSTEMARMLRMFRDLSCMMTFSIRMFYNKPEDKKAMMLICRKFLSKFLGNELPFFSLLFRRRCNALGYY